MKQTILVLMLTLLTSCGATMGPKIDQTAATEPVLLMVDLQRDFLREDGAMPIQKDQIDRVIRTANAATDYARTNTIKIAWVTNAFSENDIIGNWVRDGAAVEGSKGAEIDVRVVRSKTELTFDKSQPDAFSSDAFDAYLRQVNAKQLYIMGVFADQCVLMTVKGARNRGYDVTVITDGLGAESDEDITDAIEEYKKVGATVMTLEEFQSIAEN